MRQALRQRLSARVNRWARRRHGSQPSPVELQRNRIYILPTRGGVVFGLMLFIMLLGSMNYNNSMGLTLAFALASFVIICMHHCHRNLLALQVRYNAAEPVFAGQYAHVPVTLINTRAYRRLDVKLSYADGETDALNLEPHATRTLRIRNATHHRGRFAMERLRISCRYPCGLFEAWTWIYWDTSVLVYPAPAGSRELPRHAQGSEPGSLALITGDDELDELRAFQPGDNLSRVAWKNLARADVMNTKTFSSFAAEDLWIDWQDAGSSGTEERLSQLTRWVLTAQEQRRRYGLRLPNAEIAPGTSPDHCQQCLMTLALFP